MSVVRNRGLFTWISALLLCGTATGQQNMLWRGVVKPEAINVYQSASTNEQVTGTLRHGDAVDVVLQVSVSGSEWCRVTRAGTPEPLGFVLCLNLELGGSSPEQVAHAQQIATQLHPMETAAAPYPAPSVSVQLTNKDILDLHKAGLPEQVLVAKIKSSQTNFDTSPSQLKELKAAGLADTVILAMVEAPTGQPKPPSQAERSQTNTITTTNAPSKNGGAMDAAQGYDTKFEVMRAGSYPATSSVPAVCWMVVRDNTHNDNAYSVEHRPATVFQRCHYWYPKAILYGYRDAKGIHFRVADKHDKAKNEDWVIVSSSQLEPAN